jgi:hypothetical protein
MYLFLYFILIFKYIVQRWLQTIKLDEHYQTDLKMSLIKLEQKVMSFP